MPTGTAPIDIDTAFTTALDIFEIKAGAANTVDILGWEFGQRTELGDAQEEWLTLGLYRYSGAPTSGSGGGTSTFRNPDAQGVSFNAVIEIGNTTSISGGSVEELARFPWMIREPAIFQPTPDEIYHCAPGQYLVLKLLDAPADSIGGTNGLEGRVRIFEG